MPKLRALGDGRRCLVVGIHADSSVPPILRGAGFEVDQVSGE